MPRQNDLKVKIRLIAIFIAGAAVIVFSVLLRQKYIPFFLSVGTAHWSAVMLFHGIINQKQLLFAASQYLLKEFLFGYILSSFLLVVPVILLYITLKEIPGFESWYSNISIRIIKRRRDIFAVGAILLITLMLVTGFNFLAGRPVSTDEFAYYFQSNILKSLHLYAPAPENPEFYECESIIVKDGKWYSKYTVGFPMLLSVGAHLGAQLVVNPIISLLTLLFLFLLTRLMFNEVTAYLSVFLAVLSPFFFFNGAAAFQPHVPLVCALLGASYFYFLTIKNFRWYYPSLSAIFFTLGALIRPVDAGLWAAIFFLLSLYFILFRKDRRTLIVRFLGILAVGTIGVLVILLINKAQTGEYLKFAFHQYQSREVWGLDTYGHNFYKAVWNTLYNLTRLMSWGVVFFFELAFLSFLGGNRKKIIFLWGFFVIFVIFFFGWYAIGHFEYGPRYLFTSFIFLIPASASGLAWLFEKFKAEFPSGKILCLSFIVVIFISSIISIYPPFFPILRKQVYENIWIKLYRKAEAAQKESNKKMVVFIANAEKNQLRNINRNLYPLKKNKILYLLFLEPEKNWDLMKRRYPDRVPYIAIYDPGPKLYRIEPFQSLDKINPDVMSLYYLFAGLTYRFGLEDSKSAKEAWTEAYRLNNDNIGAIINLANIFMEEGDMEKSAHYWQKVIEMNPDISIAYFSLGQIYEKKKENEKALKFYLEFIKRAGEGAARQKALEKISYYQKYKKFP